MERKTANDKQCNLISIKTVIVLCIFTSELLSTSHALEAFADSCPVSRLTVETVENCPDTEETWKEAAARRLTVQTVENCPDTEETWKEAAARRLTVQTVENSPDTEETWKEAAARKNCAAYASQCDEPERLEYHCVINSFINETLEVCAYTQNIVFGHCADYSISGNLIKQNSRTNCKVFETKPCPFFYQSIEAYKYPGCYELTKRSKHPSPINLTALSSIYNTLHTTTNSSRLFPAGTHRQEFDNGTEKDVFIISLIFYV